MRYPKDWPCMCGLTQEQHTALKIQFHPIDNLSYVEWLDNNKINPTTTRGPEDTRKWAQVIHKVLYYRNFIRMWRRVR
jgi:hypothetical protein